MFAPESIVREFVSCGGTQPVLPEGTRDVVIADLTRLLVGPCDELKHFCEALTQARIDHGVHAVLDDLSLRHGTELPIERIWVEGLGVLGNAELAWLAIDPIALGLMSRTVFETQEPGAVWLEAMMADAVPLEHSEVGKLMQLVVASEQDGRDLTSDQPGQVYPRLAAGEEAQKN